MTKELIDYHKTKMCLAGAEGRTEDYKFHKAAIELFEKLSLPSNLDEAAEEYMKKARKHLFDNSPIGRADDAFKAGAEWYANQMKMPNSSELISAWHEVKSILQEKDFRGDEWRLAYHAFMFGFSRGINTQMAEK